MSLIDYARREIQLKLVYFGPAHAGKTTSLRGILHAIKLEEDRFITLETGPDRTLYFEFTPDRPPLRDGFTTKLLLYTVPGDVRLNTPCQLVLRDVDGIAFVVDPRWSRVEQNVQAMRNLRENLAKQDRPLAGVPLVFQYNKQDLPNLARHDYLEYLLHRESSPPRPTFFTNATEGESVMPCLNKLIELVLERFLREQ